MKDLVKNGEGISFLDEDAVRSKIKEGRLFKVLIDDHEITLDIYHADLKNHSLSKAAQAFLDLSMKEIEQRPPEISPALN